MRHFSLRIRVFMFFAALALANLGLLLWLRAGGPIGLVALGMAAALALVWALFDRNLAQPIERLAGALRARAHVPVATALDAETARYLGDLAPAARAVAQHLAEAQAAVQAAVMAETLQLSAERDDLAAVLAALPFGLVACTPDHRVMLYTGSDLSPDLRLGLDRALLDQLAPAPLLAAYAALQSAPQESRAVALELRSGAVLAARMRLLQGHNGAEHGYLLCIETPPQTPQLTYDFSLLTRARSAAIAERRLDALTYVVFDTETTGLLPMEGDEIVQLAAVRIVGGKVVGGERFDSLVNPRRPIPPTATAIHGIDDAMVAEAPEIAAVGRAFHHFVEGAVLVAHNAAFDMAFLARKELAIGLNFAHPVLDTMALSALVFGPQECHSLDALTARLGVKIPEGMRHTALGDALATAEVLLRLLAALKAQGVTRFGDLLRSEPFH